MVVAFTALLALLVMLVPASAGAQASSAPAASASAAPSAPAPSASPSSPAPEAPRPTPAQRAGLEVAAPDPGCACVCPPPGAAAGGDVGDPALRLAEAKRLFAKGNELRKAGDCASAIDFYDRSRELHASVPNTLNSAYCLEQLGRADEAYDAYTALLTEFASQLSLDEKGAVSTALGGLRPKLAILRASANVDGLLLVDGRGRGRLPLAQDLRVTPGEHIVRVVKDGWRTFETTVTVAPGATASVDARLSPLAESGRLRVDDERLAGADLFVDGTLVGQLPWEGALEPGSHYYSVRRGTIGSAPREANVVRSQTAIATVEAGPLAGEMRIVVQPSTADLTLNGVPVGKGLWRGRLPVGKHTIAAAELGYFSYVARPTFDSAHAGELAIRLEVDPNHPRWGRKQGTFWISATGGFAFGDTLGSGAETMCESLAQCPDALRDRPKGLVVGVRGGYEFPLGISIEAGLGYMFLRTSLTRKIATRLDAADGGPEIPTTYTIHDRVETSGPFVSVGARYRLELLPWLYGAAALSIGSIFAETRDNLDAQATAGGVTREVGVNLAGVPLTSAAPFLMPELAAGLTFGRFFGDIGFGMLAVVVQGPPHETRSNTIHQQPCTPQATGTVDCTEPNAKVVNEETSYGTYVVWLPRLTVGARF